MGRPRNGENSATCARPKQSWTFHGCLDYLHRKCLKDLYDEHSDSIINDRDTIKSFCAKYNVDEKHVITYVNHLKDIDIRKDIRTRAAEGRGRQEAERTYKDLNGTPSLRVAKWKSCE